MNGKRTIKLLFAAADGEGLQGLLNALRGKGLRLSEEEPEKEDIVLAVLSEAFYTDEAAQERLLSLLGSGAEKVLPLQLDAATMPEKLKNALYARNIIPAEGRDDELLAERILAALPKRKSRLPLILTAAGVVLLAAIGLLIWRLSQPGEAVPAIAETTAAPIVLPEGLTEEDLAEVADVIIAADQMTFITYDELAQYREDIGEDFDPGIAYMQLAILDEWGPDGENVHWYSRETGQEMSMTPRDDLRFLSLLPNLRSLTLVLVEPSEDAIPDLSGSEKLEWVSVLSCGLDSLDWLSGAPVRGMSVRFTPVTDFSPLTTCEKLEKIDIDMYLIPGDADFSSFSPPALNYFWLYHAGSSGRTDLSGLSGCTKLNEVLLGDDHIRDVDFLAGLTSLRVLTLRETDELRDISAARTMTGLAEFTLADCPNLTDISGLGGAVELKQVDLSSGSITDFSALAACEKLESCRIEADNLHDASFLADKPSLEQIHLFFNYMDDVDFLKTRHDRPLSMSLLGRVGDYSGLARVRYYDYLSIDGNGTNMEALRYLQNVTKLGGLSLGHMQPAEWELLPRIDDRLWIRDSYLTDLTGMPELQLSDALNILNCPNLRSLNGVESIRTLKSGKMSIYIEDCPLLSDVSALQGARLEELSIKRALIVPPLEGIHVVRYLHLEEIAEQEDLACMEGLEVSEDSFSPELVGMDALTDISALWDFHGKRVTLPPQFEEEGEALREAGNFRELAIVYHGGGWDSVSLNVEIISLEELETMPAALLRHVEHLTVLGDLVLSDPGRWSFYDRWNDDGTATPMLHDNETGENTEILSGPIGDLSVLAPLTGLKELVLWNQPLESLDGIQNLASLERLEVNFCPKLTDVSAAFALQELEQLSFARSPVRSLQGVQNLHRLKSLDLSDTELSDLSPFADAEFEEAYRENGGLRLILSGIPCEDYSALAGIRVLEDLEIDGEKCELWMPALENTEIHCLVAFHMPMDSEGFAAFVRAHPELRRLHIPWNENITDLTPALELEELEWLDVSFTMEEAIASLEGKEYRFTFNVEEP